MDEAEEQARDDRGDPWSPPVAKRGEDEAPEEDLLADRGDDAGEQGGADQQARRFVGPKLFEQFLLARRFDEFGPDDAEEEEAEEHEDDEQRRAPEGRRPQAKLPGPDPPCGGAAKHRGGEHEDPVLQGGARDDDAPRRFGGVDVDAEDRGRPVDEQLGEEREDDRKQKPRRAKPCPPARDDGRVVAPDRRGGQPTLRGRRRRGRQVLHPRHDRGLAQDAPRQGDLRGQRRAAKTPWSRSASPTLAKEKPSASLRPFLSAFAMWVAIRL